MIIEDVASRTRRIAERQPGTILSHLGSTGLRGDEASPAHVEGRCCDRCSYILCKFQCGRRPATGGSRAVARLFKRVADEDQQLWSGWAPRDSGTPQRDGGWGS